MKPIIMLVGHGTVSGKGTTIDYKGYNLIFPIPNKEPFSLSSHNMIVKRLTEALNEEEIEKELKFLISLPTTRQVNAFNYKEITLTTTLKIGTAQERTLIREQLSKAEKESISSQKAWELLEYKISPAEDILSNIFSFLPTKNHDFAMFSLMHDSFVDSNSSTLNIYLNRKIILEQLKTTKQDGSKHELFGNNFIYMTPMSNTSGDSSVMLSGVLVAIENVRILTATHDIAVAPSNTKKQKSSGSSLEMVFLENFRNHKTFTDYKSDFESKHTNTEWYEFCLPSDSNLLIGACGSEDFNF